ncbi:hypothetical protein FBU30_000522 [Linnemannia zychae]|nr:hypothetical protein FBU30_000522 [Linnemannia zychae]
MTRIPESVDHSVLDFRRTVRLLQQSKTTTKPVPTSVVKVIHDVYRKNGFRALYAGSATFTAGVTTAKILQFATYDYSAQKIKDHNYFGFPILNNSKVLSGILGAFSAVVTTFFIVPFDMVSQQITIAKAGTLPNASDLPLYVVGSSEPLSRPPPMTLSQSLHAQYKQEGLRFLFRGYSASLLTTGPFFVAYFPAYEISRVWVKDGIEYIQDVGAARSPNPNPFPPLSSHQFLISSIAGSIASVAGVLVSSPADMVKTRLQTEQRLQPTNGSGIKLPLPLLKWTSVLKDIVKKEGFMALFSGTKARAILAVPGGALNFIIFDLVRSKSLKEKPQATMQAERHVMMETLVVLDKQFNDYVKDDVEKKMGQSVLLPTSGIIPNQDVAETHMFNMHAMHESKVASIVPKSPPSNQRNEAELYLPETTMLATTTSVMPTDQPESVTHLTLMELENY